MATVTSKGQVTLPVSVRKRLGLRRGSRIVFLESGGMVRMLRDEELEDMFRVYERIGKEARLTQKKLDALVEEAKKRVWKKNYEAGR